MSTPDATLRSLEIQGTTVPKLGFGTWQLRGAACEEAVRDALAIGYRHIDTARVYGNETEVGRALAGSGVPRNEVYVTTKVAREDLAPDGLRASAEASLRDLGLNRVDLLLIHWPNDRVPLETTLGAMVALRDEGLIVHLGVSNFPPGMLREALDLAPVFADQVPFHPFRGQPELLEMAVERDFMVTAYSPLARGRVAGDPALREIGEAHGKTPGQVALRWLLGQPQVSAMPKASTHERRLENFDVFDFELTDEERARIDALSKAAQERPRM